MLPVDLGIWGLEKDQGRCSLELARHEGWVGRQTARLTIKFATYNAALRRVGFANVAFKVDDAGDVTMQVGVLSAKPADGATLLRSGQFAFELVFFLIYIYLDILPLLRKTRAVGSRGLRLASLLKNSSRRALLQEWSAVLMMFGFIALYFARIGVSLTGFAGAISLPTRDIRDHPGEFARVLQTMEWTSLMARLSQYQGFLALIALWMYMFRILLLTQFHPRMSVLVDTIFQSVDHLQHLLILYLFVIFIFAIGGHQLFGHALAQFVTMGSAFESIFLASIGDFGQLSFDLGRVEPVFGFIYFFLLSAC